MLTNLIEALITGAAVGIIGCISGQVVATRRSDGALAKRLDQIEQAALAKPEMPDFMPRAEIQQLVGGLAAETQEAINRQSQGLLQRIEEQGQMDQARRLQEARQRVQPSQDPAMAQQMAAMIGQMESLQRQVNG